MLVIMLISDKDDQEYLEALYIELKNEMLYVSNQILHNIDDAEDAVQMAFIKIIDNLQRIQNLQNTNDESQRKTAAYCIVIVRNISHRMYNSRKGKEATSLEEVDYNLTSGDKIEEIALQNNLIQQINEIANELSENLSKPFVLRYYKDMKYADIGKVLNLSPNAAQKRVERATDIILEKLGGEDLQ